MLHPASAVGSSPLPPATSGDPTDDGQSARLPLITAATSDAPTASYRAPGSSQQRRSNNLVLFVKANENESEAASRGPTLTSQPPPAQSSNGNRRGGGGDSGSDGVGSGEGGSGDGGGDGAPPDILSLVVSASSSAVSSVGGVATGAARKPLVTAALVLLYFILLDIVLLNGNERLNRVLRRIRATEDDALILLSTSLVRQLADARHELADAEQARRTALTMEGLEPVLHRVQALERVCNRSLTHLHAKLMFPGSAEDLLFLITEHATFDDRLHDLAAQELQWESTVSAAHIAGAGGDVTHPTTPDKAGPAAPAAEAAANPLRHVRLQRIADDAQPTKEATVPRAQRTKSTAAAAAAAAAARKRTSEAAKLAAEARDVEEAAAGLLAIFKNKFVAFLLMCVLLSAVLRMG